MTKAGCDLPARQLLEHISQLMVKTNPDDPVKLIYASGVIKAIGDLASFHEDLTGCRCWDAALVEIGLLPEEKRL
jgi:hypothetical protein